MALVIADRVRETTSSSGTGTITLTGAFSGFQPFSIIGNGNTTYYCIIDAAAGAWEVGIGTYTTTSGNRLSRDTVLSSSNSDALVPFAAGIKDVICTQPAERAVYASSAGTGLSVGATAFTANGVPYADSTSTLATSSSLTFDGTNLKVGSGTVSTTRTLNVLGSQSIERYGATPQLALRGGTDSTTGRDVRFSLTQTALSITASAIGGTQNSWLAFDFSNPSMNFALDGTEGMRLTSTGLGIGTSSPSYKLQLASTSAVDIETGVSNSAGLSRFGTRGSGNSFVGSFTGGKSLEFWSAGANNATLDSSGNLGIGTSSPGYKLDVATAGTGGARVTTAEYGQFVLTDGTRSIYLQNYVGVGSIGTSSNNALMFAVNNTERMRLDTNGNLGIGTSSPAQKLHVNGASGSVFAQISSGANDLYLGYDSVSGMQTMQSDTGIYFSTGASFTERMRLDSSGNLGIGTSTPVVKLDVQGASNLSTNWLWAGGNVANPPAGCTYGVLLGRNLSNGLSEANIVWGQGISSNQFFGIGKWTGSAYTEQMRLDSSGNLGLGVTPSAWDNTRKSIQLPDSAYFATSGETAFFTANTYAASGVVSTYISNGFATRYRQTAGQHQWAYAASGTAGAPITFTSGMTLDASGNLGIGRTAASGIRLDVENSADVYAFFRKTGGATVAIYGSGNEGWVYTSTNHPLILGTNGSERARIDTSGNFTASMSTTATAVTQAEKTATTTIATTAFVDRLRSLTTPSTGTSGTLVVGDRGALVAATGTVTVPASVFAARDVVTIANDSASSISIAQGSGLTMYLVGTATTGNRTLAQRGVATVVFISATVAIISGGGLT